ncbi:MAG: isopentenyl phosphate kinase [Anaerolineae bacterium]|jgi:isopentenyl phosphate kinase|nr:isopentenyl phosphate kinase [Anaerolineae bacterium]
MLTMVKLGGSLITDKTVEQSFRAEVMTRIAHELAKAIAQRPTPIILGHGSGSFGHFAAKRHDTINGVRTPEQWRGFAEVARVAAELNRLVAHTLNDAGLTVMRIQPSASLAASDGVPLSMDTETIQRALDAGIIPLVYGDVAFDLLRGGTIISTESLFTHLAKTLPVTEIFLVGEVPGVLDLAGQVIPLITPATLSDAQAGISGSRGTDVTGGMLTKVADMVALVETLPGVTIHILDGLTPGVLHTALTGQNPQMTTIRAG